MPEYEVYLCHHGVKGMKWGVRRTAAQLGHLAKAGAKRVKSAVDSRRAKKAAEKEAEERARAEKQARRKPVRKMTDDELRARMARMQLEKEYRSLLRDTEGISKGRAFMTEIAEKAGKDILTQTTAYIAGNAVNKYLFGGQDAIDPKNLQNRRKK